jgi:hypothetical protein
MIQTEFTPLQGIILILAIVALMIEFFIIISDSKKRLLEVPSILLLFDFIAFYGWLLVTSPYNRDNSFLWSQVLRLHTVMTIAIISLYRVSAQKSNNSEMIKLSNIRNGFANARDGLSNVRDDQSNQREHRLDEREKHE